MKFPAFKLRVLALALSAIFSSGAFAAMDTVGAADAQVPLLRTYGVDVPTNTGLKTILPQGWTILIHKKAVLPPTMSWKAGEPWIAAIDNLATSNNLAVRLDWTKKQVMVLPPEAAIEQKAQEEQIHQAATTPIPAYHADSVTNQTPAVSKSAVLATVASDPAKTPPVLASAPTVASLAPTTAARQVAAAPRAVIQSTPEADAIEAKASALGFAASATPTPSLEMGKADNQTMADKLAALKHAAEAGTVVGPAIASTASAAPLLDAVPVTVPIQPSSNLMPRQESLALRNGAQSQVGGSLHDLVEGMAQKEGYALSWEAPDADIPGAVTLLGVDIAEDAKLIQKAMNPAATPVAFLVYRSSNVLRVVPRQTASSTVEVLDSPYTGTLMSLHLAAPQAAYDPNVSAPTVLNASVAAKSYVPTPVSSAIATAPVQLKVADTVVATPSVKLTVLKGESLTKVLKVFFTGLGWDLEWQAPGDMQAEYPVTIVATDAKEVMRKLLPRLALTADFYDPSKVVVIRQSDMTTN